MSVKPLSACEFCEPAVFGSQQLVKGNGFAACGFLRTAEPLREVVSAAATGARRGSIRSRSSGHGGAEA